MGCSGMMQQEMRTADRVDLVGLQKDDEVVLTFTERYGAGVEAIYGHVYLVTTFTYNP